MSTGSLPIAEDADRREAAYRRRWEETASGDERAKALWRAYEFAGVARGASIVQAMRRFTSVEGKRVLDVGCGQGGACIAFAQAGAQVFGTDLSASQLDLAHVRAQGYGANAHWFVADAVSLPVKKEAFDIIICNDVVEHVPRPAGLIAAMASALKAGGVIYLEAPNRLAWRELLRDGHYGLPGVSLLPRPLAALYVCRIARRAPAYTVSQLPTWWGLRRQLARAGLLARPLDEREQTKLTQPELIQSLWLRCAARLLRRCHLDGLARCLLGSALWRGIVPRMWRVLALKPPRVAGAPTESAR